MVATLKDVAKKANVSIATVSRVLNDSVLISDDTRRKVRSIMNELDYRPYAQKRNDLRKNINTIGLLMPDIKNNFYSIVIRGVKEELEKNGFSLILSYTDEDIEKEKNYLDTYMDIGVNGVILLGTRPAKLKHEYIINLSKRLPVLMINDYIMGSNIYSVMTDEVEGAYSAVNHLIKLGHERIAFINGDVDYTTYRYKHRGYEKALEASSLKIEDKYHIKVAPYEEGGYLGMKKFLQMKKDRPTAIFTASDQIAAGVYKAIYAAGLTIPGDFSIIGFSGIPLSKSLFPELTTVDQFAYNTGSQASKTLMKLITGENLEQKRIILEPKLILRDSCVDISLK